MRDDNYRHLLGSRVWKNIRAEYLALHPICEDCAARGDTRLATEVHHIIPISHEKTHEASGTRLNKDAIRARHAKQAASFVENFLKPSLSPPRGE